MPRHDSLKDAPVIRGSGMRAIVLPTGFLQALPSLMGDWVAKPLPDGRVILGIEEVDLAGHVVETLSQIEDGRGRVSDRRYDILRALCTDAEWAEAEMTVSTIASIANL